MSLDQALYTERDPKDIMAEHGKSFYWASHLFSKQRFADVALLYAFCRYVDDTADENDPELAPEALAQLKANFRKPQDPFLKEVRSCFKRLGINMDYADQLISGAQFDVEGGLVKSRRDLLVYCYKVAGVVGLMMCPVIGVRDPRAEAFALDLGIAMQLTNICRDILEDAKNGRYYLPRDELETRDICREGLAQEGASPEALKELVADYLDLADSYYASAMGGYSRIPFRPRLAIHLAAKVYQAIGHKIRSQGYEVLAGRCFLSKREKVLVSMKAVAGLLHPKFWWPAKHENSLHKSLQGLPGVVRA